MYVLCIFTSFIYEDKKEDLKRQGSMTFFKLENEGKKKLEQQIALARLERKREEKGCNNL